MRLSLSLLASAALVGAVLVPAAPAHADTTVVVHGVDTESDFLAIQNCADWASAPNQGAGTISITRTQPALGQRSYRVGDFPTGSAVGFAHDIPSVATDPVLTLSVLATSGTTTVVRLLFSTASDTVNYWEGKATPTLSPSNDYQVLDLAPLTYTWTQRSQTTNQPTGMTTSGTPTTFVATHGGDGDALALVGLGCNGETTQFDGLQFGHAGAVTTFDFEGYLTTVAASPAQTVAPGAAATLSTTVTATASNGEPATVHGGVVDLQQSNNGAWSTVTAGVEMSEDTGLATTVVHPSVTTTYRWVYAGAGECCEASTSEPFTITVKATPSQPALTASAKKKVTQGKSIVVKGKVTPAQPGATVTLWAQKSGADKKLGTGVATVDGSFQIKVKAKKPGKLVLYVTTVATAASTAGTSATFKVTVKKKPKH